MKPLWETRTRCTLAEIGRVAVARVNASYTDIGEAFNPEVGYVYRTGSTMVSR